MERVALDRPTLEWLLDPADAALRAKVLVELEGRSSTDPTVLAARRAIPEQPFVAAILDAWESGRVRELRGYQKYRGATWALAHLGEMGVAGDHPVIEEGVAYLLATARPVRRILGAEVAPLKGAPALCWEYPIACLTARLATVLARYGRADHPVARGARATLVHLYRHGWGLDCGVMARSLLPACVMSVPEVLTCLLAVPKAERTPAERDIVVDGARLLDGVELYRYPPARGPAFRAATEGMGADEARAVKARWLRDGRVEPRGEKKGWLRFSFPLGYNPDLLQVLRVLAAAGAERSPTVERGLELVVRARGRDGRWKLVGGLNGKMWADRGRKGAPDPWVTYRALTVLKAFGALEG